MRRLNTLVRSLRDLLLSALPLGVITIIPGDVGAALRYAYYRRRMKSLGRDVYFDVGVQLVNPQYMSIGDNTWIDRYVVLLAGPPGEGRLIRRKANPDFGGSEGELIIGANCHLAPHVLVSAHGGVEIGDDSGIASGARVYSLSHHYRNPDDETDTRRYSFTPQAPPEAQVLIAGPVVLQRNTAVGLNSVVLPGSTLEENSWLGTLSTAVGRLPADGIFAGNPAVRQKHR